MYAVLDLFFSSIKKAINNNNNINKLTISVIIILLMSYIVKKISYMYLNKSLKLLTK